MLTIHLHLAPRLRMSGALILPPPMCLHGVDSDNFNYFKTHIEYRAHQQHSKSLREGNYTFSRAQHKFILIQIVLT